MQISNTLATNFFTPKPLEPNPTRMPAVIPAETTLLPVQRRPQVSPSQFVSPLAQSSDIAQSRFIRSFAIIEQYPDDRAISRSALSTPVQTYLQIAALTNSPPTDRLIDETV